ncbi:MAG TPA: trypsin-like peptidase domain-containing protein [Solirubrobacteraceae bacterium]|nr:trypsin-like peptidase domain-containing protein [Solirubrobacteraceae bacterium]
MRRGLVALGAAALLAAGCGGGSKTRTVQTTTTKVEVVRQAGAETAGFDARSIYERDAPGVVTVISTGLQSVDGDDSGLGSGFVISGDGEIATNAHVVTSGEGAAIRKASNVYVRFGDGNQVPADVRGFDPFSDVALLKVDPKGLTLRPLPLGSTADLHVGAPVAAIGSPFAEEQSLSVGVISGLDRSIESLTGFATTGAIQTDAAINHGNSGGPLLDGRGRVLGINAQIQTSTGDGSGVGFAVPADVVKSSLAQLRRDGRAHYAYLGVSHVEVYPQLAEHFHLAVDSGAWVQDVTAGGPAQSAHVREGDETERFQDKDFRVGGDVITAVEGKAVRGESDLAKALLAHKPGDTVTVAIRRGDKRLKVRIKLGERPLDSPRRG